MPAIRGGKKGVGKVRARCRSGRQRQKMRPWLESLLESKSVPGLVWSNRKKGIFSIRWKHASGRSFKTEEDSDLFMRYAKHTGKYEDGKEPDHKRWKANFRCALHSLDDVEELHGESNKKGEKAVRVYRFLDGPKDGSKTKQQGSEVNSAAKNLELMTKDSPMHQQDVKMEVASPGCSYGPVASPPPTDGEDTDGEHSYSKNGLDGIPKLHTFNNLLTGGSVELCVDTHKQPPTNLALTIEYLKSEQEYTECLTPESDMTLDDVVEIVSNIIGNDSGYSDTDSNSNSPEHPSLWGTDFGLEGSQRAKVVTEAISLTPFGPDATLVTL